MSRFHTVEDARVQEFYQLPKDLIKNPIYKKLSASAKIAYSILRDRHSVSLKNQWIDEKGRVYFLFSDQELADLLDASHKSANRYKNDLQSYGLIHMERQGLNRRNKIYLLKPEAGEEYKKLSEPLQTKDWTKLSNPDETKLSNQEQTKLSNPDETKLSTLSNTDLSNKDFNKLVVVGNPIEKLIDLIQKKICKPSEANKERLQEWLNKLPYEIIESEINYAAERSARNFAYVEKALKNDYELNLDTLEKLDRHRKEHSAKNGFKRNSGGNKKTREEKLPEWFESRNSPNNDVLQQSDNDDDFLAEKAKLEAELAGRKKAE